MTKCAGLGFTECIRCEDIGNYRYAAGWTSSWGIGAVKYPYIVPDGWEADPDENDILGEKGSHGGCFECAMTLVHLRRYLGVEPPPECPEDIPEGTYKCVGGYSYECIGGKLYKSEQPDPRCDEVEPVEPTPTNGTSCPIACVCMGTTLIDALGPIREFRDFVLKKSKNGKRFVSLYYNQIGPSLTYVLNKSEMLRKAGRLVVKAILKKLEK